jgi:hypothetical protein
MDGCTAKEKLSPNAFRASMLRKPAGDVEIAEGRLGVPGTCARSCFAAT